MVAKSREADGEKLSRNTRQLKELTVGMPALLQNQTGSNPSGMQLAQLWSETTLPGDYKSRWQQKNGIEEQKVHPRVATN